jgi:hypothetical protein
MITPVLEILLSASRSPAGMAPSPNRRLPDPMTTGKIHRRNWSTRLARSSVWMRLALPCTWSSGPSSCLRAARPSAASPSIWTELLHASRLGRLREATYLVASLKTLPPASSGAVGQYADMMSNVRRPSTMANGLLVAAPMTSPIWSSQ